MGLPLGISQNSEHTAGPGFATKNLEIHFIEFIAYWNEFKISREALNLKRSNDLISDMDKRANIILKLIAETFEHSK